MVQTKTSSFWVYQNDIKSILKAGAVAYLSETCHFMSDSTKSVLKSATERFGIKLRVSEIISQGDDELLFPLTE